MKDQPNPAWVNAPFECSGIINGTPFVASAAPPGEDGDIFTREETLWIKMPERQPMHFKGGRWVPWLNPPPGWDSMLPAEPEGRHIELENFWRFPDC